MYCALGPFLTRLSGRLKWMEEVLSPALKAVVRELGASTSRFLWPRPYRWAMNSICATRRPQPFLKIFCPLVKVGGARAQLEGNNRLFNH